MKGLVWRKKRESSVPGLSEQRSITEGYEIADIHCLTVIAVRAQDQDINRVTFPHLLNAV